MPGQIKSKVVFTFQRGDCVHNGRVDATVEKRECVLRAIDPPPAQTGGDRTGSILQPGQGAVFGQWAVMPRNAGSTELARTFPAPAAFPYDFK